MKAEIINIGDEILIGQVVNTNASWMSEKLYESGIEVIHITAIADTKDAIFNALNQAINRADIVLMTGGLGPTKDDITKKCLCEYFNTKLVFYEEAYENIKRLFKTRGFKISEVNRQQAELPEKATLLPNPNGTAYGMWFEQNNKVIVSMPGVPFEMKALLQDEIIPRIIEKFGSKKLLKRTILTQGVGESHLAEIIENWENELPGNFKLAYLPQPGIVRLRLSAEGKGIEKEFDDQLEKLHQLIPDLIWGYEDDLLEEIIGVLLKEKKQSISTAESCTGGYISHLITSIPGSSEYFKGSVVAYSNEIKKKVLNVHPQLLAEFGAVSKEVVIEMAQGVKKLFQTDYAIATSGVAGPDGGSKEKPVGTVWIALALPDGSVRVKNYLFGKNRERNIRITALTALNQLRKLILRS